MAKQKKYTLFVEEELEFEVFGLSSPFAYYRLAWELNNRFEFKFEKSLDLFSLTDRKTKVQRQFQHFHFEDEENHSTFYLLKNKQGNQSITNEHNLMDFFLIIKNNLTIETNQFLNQLRNTNGIVAAFKLENEDFDFIDYI
jgi:hypothetical protein